MRSIISNDKSVGFVIRLTAKKLFILIISLQITLFGLLALDKLGLEIPVIRQFIAFIYLSFIPGFLILGILRLNIKNITKTLLYSTGLSLSYLMAVGYIVNTFYPLIGFLNPISEESLIPPVFLSVLFLSMAFYLRNKNNKEINVLPIRTRYLAFTLLPLISIFGTYLLNYYNINHLILILFGVVSLSPILVAFVEFRDEDFILLILTIALSLILYNSLFGTYQRPTDNIMSYYLAKLVVNNGIWNPSIPNNMNGMLSIVILLPIFSEICKIPLTWVFKICIPLLSSLIPVATYVLYREAGNKKEVAFFASFFLVSMFFYFCWVSVTMKLMSGTLFLVLLLLTMCDSEMKVSVKKFLALVFTFSLIVSYYGWSYVFLVGLTAAIILILLIEKNSEKNPIITPSYFTLYVVILLSWYMYHSACVPFEFLVKFSRDFISTLTTELFFPKEVYGTQLLLGTLPPYLQILKVLYIISASLTFIYLAPLWYKKLKNRNVDQYTALSIPFFAFMVAPYIFGGVGKFAGAGSFVYFSYLLLAPFFVNGFLGLFERVAKFQNYKNMAKKGVISLGVFLCVFSLLNSGFLAEVIWKHNITPSAYVSKPRILYSDSSLEEKAYFDYIYLSTLDIESGKWIAAKKQKDYKVFCGPINAYQNLWMNGLTHNYYLKGIGSQDVFSLTNKILIPNNSYIYLTEFNIKTKKLKQSGGVNPEYSNIPETWQYNKIYTNDGSKIYYR